MGLSPTRGRCASVIPPSPSMAIRNFLPSAIMTTVASPALSAICEFFSSAYTIEIGHIWHAVERQRGTATTETAFLLIECAFQLGYRRVEWKCNAANERSRRAALRLGFSFEGVFRQQNVFKKRNRDTAWFAVLDDDWPAIRSNFLRWFDSPASSLSGMNRPHVDWSLAAHDAWPPPAQT